MRVLNSALFESWFYFGSGSIAAGGRLMRIPAFPIRASSFWNMKVLHQYLSKTGRMIIQLAKVIENQPFQDLAGSPTDTDPY